MWTRKTKMLKFFNGIGIEHQKMYKQVKGQRDMKADKDDAQMLLENKNE